MRTKQELDEELSSALEHAVKMNDDLIILNQQKRDSTLEELLTKYNTKVDAEEKRYAKTHAFYLQQKQNMINKAQREYQEAISKLKNHVSLDPEAFIKSLPEKKRYSILKAAGLNYGRDTTLKKYTDEQVALLKQEWYKEAEQVNKKCKDAEEVIETKKVEEEVELHNTIGSVFFTGEPEDQEDQYESDSDESIVSHSSTHKADMAERMRKAKEKLSAKAKAKGKVIQNELVSEEKSQAEIQAEVEEEVPEESPEQSPFTQSPQEQTNSQKNDEALNAFLNDNYFSDLKRKARAKDAEEYQKECSQKAKLSSSRSVSTSSYQQPFSQATTGRNTLASKTSEDKPISVQDALTTAFNTNASEQARTLKLPLAIPGQQPFAQRVIGKIQPKQVIKRF